MVIKPKIEKILFATDLSENAEYAFSYAAAMAEAFGARVGVLHVIEKLPPNAELLLVSFLGYRNAHELRQKSQAELIVALKNRIERFCAEVGDHIPTCRLSFHEVAGRIFKSLFENPSAIESK